MTNERKKTKRLFCKRTAGLLFLVFSVWIFARPHGMAIAADSASGQNLKLTVSSTAPFNHCANHIKDYDETGVDCGGSACSACSTGGGGGGGSGGVTLKAQVFWSGTASPGATVHILKDGAVVSTITANASGFFQASLPNINAGTYNFSIYAVDTAGLQTPSLSFPALLTDGTTVSYNNLLLPPTITTDKTEVKKGDPITISGSAAPFSTVQITITSKSNGQTTAAGVAADSSGSYIYTLNTSPLGYGDYSVAAKETLGAVQSAYSQTVDFKIGTQDVLRKQKPAGCPIKGDLNGDCRVNLIDFSIAAYWYRRVLNSDFSKLESLDLNGDGLINLIDFSIIAYYWTG